MSAGRRAARDRHDETVRKWVPPGRGRCWSRPGITTEESAELKRLRAGERRAEARQRNPEDGVGFLRGRARPAHH